MIKNNIKPLTHELSNAIYFGFNIFITEQLYWKNLNISGYTWYFLRPTLFFFANFLLFSHSIDGDISDILMSVLTWSVFWYSCTISVQYVRRLRRFFCKMSINFLTFLFFTLIDHLVNLTLMSSIVIIIGAFKGVFVLEPYALVINSFYFVLVFPIVLYIGMLSINALDFSNMFVFLPILLLYICLSYDSSSILSYLLPVVFKPFTPSVSISHYLISLIFLVPTCAILMLQCTRGRKAVFANAIA